MSVQKYSYNGDYTNPCQSFTGKICLDGSCHGVGACFNGVIPTVINSCNGTRACSGVAANKGKAGHFESSCVGDRVCEFAGASFTTGVSSGAISNITKSCIGYRACYGAGAGVGFGEATGRTHQYLRRSRSLSFAKLVVSSTTTTSNITQ